jgi:hypothetical protein
MKFYWTPVTYSYHHFLIPFLIPKRISNPTITSYSPATGTSGKVRNASTNTDIDTVSVYLSQFQGCVQVNNVSVSDQQQLQIHYTCDADF